MTELNKQRRRLKAAAEMGSVVILRLAMGIWVYHLIAPAGWQFINHDGIDQLGLFLAAAAVGCLIVFILPARNRSRIYDGN